MVTLDNVTIIVSTIIAFIALVISVLSWRIAKKAQEPRFELNRRESIVEGGRTAIEVSHLDKPIEKCNILYKDQQLICADNKDPSQPEKFILSQQGAALFRIPKSIEDEEAYIKVRSGKKTLMSVTLKDIHRS